MNLVSAWRSVFGEPAQHRPGDELVVAQACPEATLQECEHFLMKHVEVDATVAALKEHLGWRETVFPNVPSLEEFHCRWMQEGTRPRPFLRVVPDVRCEEDPTHPVTVMFNGLLVSPDKSMEDHTLYVLRHLDDLFSRDSRRGLIVLIYCESVPDDVPVAEFGLDKVPATQMIPWFMDVCDKYVKHYPERLTAAFIYPLPMLVVGLWQGLLSPFVDPRLANKLTWSCGGKDGCDIPVEVGTLQGEDFRLACGNVMKAWRAEQRIAYEKSQRCA